MVSEPFGEALPRRQTDRIPGPRSRELARRLAAVESRNITLIDDAHPIFWTEARGANVRDADGNVYVDLTAGFSVAAAGHANPRVADAIAAQAARLPHGLGDVHPPDVKVELLERLAAVAPDPLGVSILANSGAEAVEAALKTAVMYTGRPGVLAFSGGYHGLTYGALAATHREDFREPFRDQLYGGIRFARYPDPYRWGGEGDIAAAALADARRLLDEGESSDSPIGAVLVEPVQGRGGLVVPPPEFLPGLRRICEARGLVLIVDEIYTGFGRTGRWFACQHVDVVPDVLVVGKALTGAVPLSAAIGSPEIMSAWPPSAGEAIHTSTFLGNPVACAAAIAELRELDEKRLVERSAALGRRVRRRLDAWAERYAVVAEARGVGMMQGVELVDDPESKSPATARAGRIVGAALERGVLVLAEGPAANVLAFTPPLVITERQIDVALDVVEEELAKL